MFKNSWKTTVFGALAAACGVLSKSDNSILSIVGVCGTALFTFLLGNAAADK